MAQEDVPEHIRRFIVENIDSVELLRILAMLIADPDKEWTVSELTRELRSSDSAVQIRLDDLYGRKILAGGTAGPGRHKFAPHSPELLITIKALLEYFEVRPYLVIGLIYSRPSAAIRAFADAFKIKKERE